MTELNLHKSLLDKLAHQMIVGHNIPRDRARELAMNGINKMTNYELLEAVGLLLEEAGVTRG